MSKQPTVPTQPPVAQRLHDNLARAKQFHEEEQARVKSALERLCAKWGVRHVRTR